MIEAFGDASRNGDWASVRLRVDGDRIVDADADGLERPLAGLTLLEAAAVGGETLATDALANALGPLFRASRDPERVAVAMSGGVDSAVALLRAGPGRRRRDAAALARPGGAGLGARLLLARRGDRGAADLPRARPAARHARPARGVPARGRGAVRRRLRARRDAEPVHALQRRLPLRRAARASPAGSARRRSRPATTHGSSRTAAACCSRARSTRDKDQSYMLAALDPARLERVWFPLGEQSKEETRAEAAQAGLAAAARAESQEACFLAGDDYREFLERHGAEARPARSSTRRATSSAARGHLALHARPAQGRRRRGRQAALRAADGAARRHGRRRAARGARPAARVGPRPALRAGRAGRGQAPLPLPGVPARVVEARAASGSSSTSPRTASPPARPPSSTRTTPSSGTAW